MQRSCAVHQAGFRAHFGVFWNPPSQLLSIISVEVDKKIGSGSDVAQVLPAHFQLYNEAAQSLAGV